MDKSFFQESYERLKSDAIREVETASPAKIMEFIMIREALSGDPSFLQSTANKLCKVIVQGEEMDANQRHCLGLILLRLSTNQSAAIALSGKRNKGAPKKGQKALSAATFVIEAVMDGGATSIEKAWEMVAMQNNLDISTVKKYWVQWKPYFQETLSETFSSDGMVKGFDDALKDMLRTNAGKQ